MNTLEENIERAFRETFLANPDIKFPLTYSKTDIRIGQSVLKVIFTSASLYELQVALGGSYSTNQISRFKNDGVGEKTVGVAWVDTVNSYWEEFYQKNGPVKTIHPNPFPSRRIQLSNILGVPPTHPQTPFVKPFQPLTPFVPPIQPLTPFVPPTQPQTPFVKPLQPQPPFVTPTQPLTPFVTPTQPLTPVTPTQPQTPFVTPIQPVYNPPVPVIPAPPVKQFPPPVIPSNIIRECNELLNKQDFQNAKNKAEELVRMFPLTSQHHVLLGRAVSGLGDLQTALNHFSKALELNNQDNEALLACNSTMLSLTINEFRQNNIEGGNVYYNQLDWDLFSEQEKFQLASVLFDIQDFDSSTVLLTRLLNTPTQEIRAQVNHLLGFIALSRESFVEGEKYYETAISLGYSQKHRSFFRLGECLYRQGKYKEARGKFEESNKLQISGETLYYIASCDYYLSNYESAIGLLKKCLELEPTHSRALFRQGLCHKKAKQNTEAIAILSKYSQIDPNNEICLWSLAELYSDQKDFDRAKDYYQAILSQQEGNFEAVVRLVNVLTESGKFEETISAIDNFLNSQKDKMKGKEQEHVLKLQKAQRLVDLKKNEQATAILNEILSEDPQNKNAQDLLKKAKGENIQVVVKLAQKEFEPSIDEEELYDATNERIEQWVKGVNNMQFGYDVVTQETKGKIFQFDLGKAPPEYERKIPSVLRYEITVGDFIKIFNKKQNSTSDSSYQLNAILPIKLVTLEPGLVANYKRALSTGKTLISCSTGKCKLTLPNTSYNRPQILTNPVKEALNKLNNSESEADFIDFIHQFGTHFFSSVSLGGTRLLQSEYANMTEENAKQLAAKIEAAKIAQLGASGSWKSTTSNDISASFERSLGGSVSYEESDPTAWKNSIAPNNWVIYEFSLQSIDVLFRDKAREMMKKALKTYEEQVTIYYPTEGFYGQSPSKEVYILRDDDFLDELTIYFRSSEITKIQGQFFPSGEKFLEGATTANSVTDWTLFLTKLGQHPIQKIEVFHDDKNNLKGFSFHQKTNGEKKVGQVTGMKKVIIPTPDGYRFWGVVLSSQKGLFGLAAPSLGGIRFVFKRELGKN